jgi:hypothetical protein
MGGPVERAYLVSVDDLRGICETLTDGKREYKLVCEDEGQAVIDYNDGPDDLNAISYAFPIVVNLNVKGRASLLFGKQWPFGEDGLMVCLHIYTRNPIRRGLYPEGNQLFGDSLDDWEKFWGPLEAALVKGMECQSR